MSLATTVATGGTAPGKSKLFSAVPQATRPWRCCRGRHGPVRWKYPGARVQGPARSCSKDNSSLAPCCFCRKNKPIGSAAPAHPISRGRRMPGPLFAEPQVSRNEAFKRHRQGKSCLAGAPQGPCPMPDKPARISAPLPCKPTRPAHELRLRYPAPTPRHR